MKKIVLITLLITICIVGEAGAQKTYWKSAPKKSLFSKLTIDGGVGLMAFYGDMQTRGKTNPFSFNYSLSVIKHVKPRWSWSGQVVALKYKGEKLFGDRNNTVQNMEGKFVEGTINFNYNIIKFHDFGVRVFTIPDPITKFNIYVSLGVGAAMFSANVTGSGNSGSFVLPRSESRKIAVLVPIGFGAKYRMNKHVSLGIETGYKNYLTDALDATSINGTASDKLGLTQLKFGYTF